jgi:hypothetical protein
MINNRNNGGVGASLNSNGLTYWVSDKGPLDDISNWRKVTAAIFQKLLVAAADQFPSLPASDHENQQHVTILIHGYNVRFANSTSFYEKVCGRLFHGPSSLGLCILFEWPSPGFEPDRRNATRCAEDLTDALSCLFDWFLEKQQRATANPAHRCKAKISLIAHGYGNYVLQKAMSATWVQKYRPNVSFINQLLMVAPDVSSDLFDVGSPDHYDGLAMVNLTYRIVVLYSGRDAFLAAPSGLKHAGTRRLGRAGLANRPPLGDAPPHIDNVWDVDCSSFFPPNLGGEDIHSAYFVTDGTINLMRQVLRGTDPDLADFKERHNEARLGGVKTIVYDSRTMGDRIETHFTGGTFNAQVAAVMNDCTNIINNQSTGEQKRLLETLQKQVGDLLTGPPDEKLQLKKKVTNELKELTEGVTSGTPDRAWYSVSAKGLLEAAKFVKDFSGEIGETLKSLGKTIWPDFAL